MIDDRSAMYRGATGEGRRRPGPAYRDHDDREDHSDRNDRAERAAHGLLYKVGEVALVCMVVARTVPWTRGANVTTPIANQPNQSTGFAFGDPPTSPESPESASAEPRRGRGFGELPTKLAWIEWVGATTAGVALGVVLVLALHWAEHAVHGATLTPSVQIEVHILSGVLQGLALSTMQWLVLRRFLYEFPAARSIAPTTLAVISLWMMSLALGGIGGIDGNALVIEPPLLLTGIGIVAAGATTGAILGAAQWATLPPKARRRSGWVRVHVVAWIVAFAIVHVAESTIPVDASRFDIAVRAIASTVAIGVVVGAVTGFAAMRVFALAVLAHRAGREE